MKGAQKFQWAMNLLDRENKNILSADHCGNLALPVGYICSTLFSMVCIKDPLAPPGGELSGLGSPTNRPDSWRVASLHYQTDSDCVLEFCDILSQ